MGTLARYHAENLPELFDRITKNSIGMDDYLNRFWESETTSKYPPYNLVQLNNHESKLEIALAGFKKKEVKVYTEFGKLYVDGKHANLTSNDVQRRNRIAQLLADWGLVSVVNTDKIQDIAPLNQIKVLAYKDKGDWILETKYNIGSKKKKVEETE